MTAMFNNKAIGGPKGDPGATFIPSVSEEGVISWTNDAGLPNPEPVNIKWAQGGGVYSTEETRIGTWVDGKPLYRTIISLGDIALPGLNETPIYYDIPGAVYVTSPVAVAGIDTVVFDYISLKGFNEGKIFGGRALRYFVITSGEQWGYVFEQNMSSNNVIALDVKVILEYTKTTDVTPATQALLTSNVTLPETLSVASIAPNAPASL